MPEAACSSKNKFFPKINTKYSVFLKWFKGCLHLWIVDQGVMGSLRLSNSLEQVYGFSKCIFA